MKSEHLKTELITNVSHDIKTPLTSIINYADLLGTAAGKEEGVDREMVSEYSEVLLRQSKRLKKLLEDLVEASKATTGNLEVMMERMNSACWKRSLNLSPDSPRSLSGPWQTVEGFGVFLTIC